MTTTSQKRKWILDLVMLPIGLVVFFPFYLIIINTFKTMQDATRNPIGLPKEWILTNYVQVFEETALLRSFGNSLTITFFSVALVVLIGAMGAYPVVFNANRVTKFAMLYLLAGFMIPFQATLIPLFQLMTGLNLIDRLYGLIALYLNGSVFVFFLMMGYMRTIPRELSEAAVIDGCSVWGIFWRIIFPLLKPISTTAIIFQTMWIWNDFLAPMLFLNSSSNSTLVLQIYRAKGEFTVQWPMFMTLTVVTLLPIFLFFIFMQKHIVKGIASGAVKG
ncbi:carbohydrate ABC transporter permease [Paenibacillus sp. 598K]|uniref:carbohydrate ABC transporter permease n=1 Tax=Paenibacillus sp. 598K TaxID=1117987 RepID=UPI000FFF0A48|nr:carbohydrate ABC transporter permease [Paenibacillus sp. 598K]